MFPGKSGFFFLKAPSEETFAVLCASQRFLADERGGFCAPGTWSDCKQWGAYGLSSSNKGWDAPSNVELLWTFVRDPGTQRCSELRNRQPFIWKNNILSNNNKTLDIDFFLSSFFRLHMCKTVSDVSLQERVRVLRVDAASARNIVPPPTTTITNTATWAGAQPGLIIGELWCLVSPGMNVVMPPCPALRRLENTWE